MARRLRASPCLASVETPPAKGDLFAAVAQTSAVQELRRRVEKGGAWSGGGFCPAVQPYLAVLLQRLFPQRPIVVVTDGLKTQEGFQQDMETWLAESRGWKIEGRKPDPPAHSVVEPNPGAATSGPRPLFFPAWEILPHESKLPHADVISERLETLVALASPAANSPLPAALIVTTVVALTQRTFPPGAIAARTRTLRRGDRLDPLDLVEWLEAQGYEPEAQVTRKGEIALRGGILDVFPLISPWPVRLEFFGDELESLRHFDPQTQISRHEIVAVTLPPAGELGILKRHVGEAVAAGFSLRGGVEGAKGEEAGRPGRNLKVAATPVLATPLLATLLDYLPRETIFLLCDPESLSEHADAYAAQVPEGDSFFIPWEELYADILQRGLAALLVSDAEDGEAGPEGSEPPTPSRLPSHFSSLDALRPVGGRTPDPLIAEALRREFFAQLHRWLRQGFAVHVFCNTDGERQRFEEIWEELGLGSDVSVPGAEAGHPGHQTSDPRPLVHLGSLACGFWCAEAKLAVVTDAEIFGRYRVQRPRRLKSPHAVATRSALDIDFGELEEGDYVVHLQHGIGRYRGLKMLASTSRKSALDAGESGGGQTDEAGQECLVIEYAANEPGQPPPRLYVPLTESHLIGKYVGAGKARPPLNALGGGRWAKAKAHAEKSVRDLAADLLKIQAARAAQAGHAFGADTPWQREFEGSFIYEETVDQARAIREAKADLESPKPMDRLVCGDVGYGKTEVAIRAAFKAVMGGKQVAILVPTTILAQQHFNTFRERMADYPVRVELLSRFRTRREQLAVIGDLATGAVDIVIGTHRLVQADIAFKDLGLVVVDEEQRFGVVHKERFKQLRQLVDVLTLSATPIPRTLYLALTGARDMSTIQTPPHDRLPVETMVTQYDERLIRDAIQRELNRGGQVYFLHNRVMTIGAMKQKLALLLPKARVVVGHGQMDPDELEEAMTKFVNGEADVLLSTSIIESGLDIPNANTIIIDRADRFGLSELYQLRGRVGRYKHQAHAYLLLPRHASLLADVRKRMSAIKQYSTLGSGFKIAMRDLEIRGAGNLLGAQQSGHITAVGFELYCQLLKQSVAALKGEKVKPRVEVAFRLDFLALNPGEETAPARSKFKIQNSQPEPAGVSVPREVATYVSRKPDEGSPSGSGAPAVDLGRAAAYIPHGYISEPQQRIEFYRKLAQATDKACLDGLRAELRDRFGPFPAGVDLLLLAGELKILASQRGITTIETKGDKLMITRHGDYLTLGGKFPRLMKPQAKARLGEIRKLLLAL